MKAILATALVALTLAASIAPASAFDARKFFDMQTKNGR